jgi:aryl-alcohol dehydrogenase-like predicted oxidoreductase
MPMRRLGSLTVSALGLGCMRMSAPGCDPDAMIATMRAALDAGITLFDTAASYGSGGNEELLGRFLARTSAGATVATKCGIVRGSAGDMGVDGTPAGVRASAEASLRRLGTDVIDLLYQHRVDPQVPIEETAGALGELVARGKVRHIGLCEASASTLRRAAGEARLTALQSEWSLWSRGIEAEVVPTARELGIGLVCYSPLGRGFFADSPPDVAALPADDFRRHNARYLGESGRQNEHIREEIAVLAAARGLSLEQFALAWLLGQGDDVVPIPGTTSVVHLAANVAAATAGALDADALALVDELPAKRAWAGERYPAGSFLAYDSTPERAPRGLTTEPTGDSK